MCIRDRYGAGTNRFGGPAGGYNGGGDGGVADSGSGGGDVYKRQIQQQPALAAIPTAPACSQRTVSKRDCTENRKG